VCSRIDARKNVQQGGNRQGGTEGRGQGTGDKYKVQGVDLFRTGWIPIACRRRSWNTTTRRSIATGPT